MRPWMPPLGVLLLALIPSTGLGQLADRPSPMPAPPSPNMPDPARVAAITEIIDEDLPTLGPIRELVGLPVSVLRARRYGPRPVQLYETALTGDAAQPGPAADHPPGLPGLVPDLTARARMLTGSSPNRTKPGPSSPNPAMAAASPRLTWLERLAAMVPSTTSR